MLLVFGGLPGTGKSTIAKALAAKRSAAYVRVDEIEQALRLGLQLGRDVGPVGYLIAFSIASSNLQLGNWVVADSVNPLPETRDGWRDVANRVECGILEIEVICSDENEHRRRVESRVADIAGLELPTWLSVKTREYVPWSTPRLLIDTAILRPDDAISQIETRILAMSADEPERKWRLPFI